MGLMDRFRRQDEEEQRSLDDPGSIRRALWLEQFDVHFQPVVDLQSGSLVGIEAFVRWEHPDVGVIPAQRFVPVAERAGLLLPLDIDTLRTASAFRRDLTAASQLRVTLNLSQTELIHPDLVETLREILDQTGLPTEQLEVELSEAALEADPDVIAETVRKLHASGVAISIDDFGSDPEHLKLVQRLPVDQVKIDLSRVIDLPDAAEGDERKALEAQRAAAEASIERAVRQAQEWGLEIGAKRVESLEHLRFLRGLGITRAQGFVLGRPVSSSEFGHDASDLQQSA